ncbi:MAG: peptidylprolyl isomerase [Winogradskyella sp.]|uniref:peptidylprolyl isomerase n=1 Tax=Winogradskyella sp. TaxID=1883156 RepID=UPI00385E6D11
MKTLFTILLLIPLITFSQESLEQQLDSISTADEANTFLKANKPKQGKLFTFNKKKHKTRLANDLFSLSKGGKKVVRTEFKRTYYKVVDKSDVMYSKFSIIVLGDSETSNEALISKRNKVMAQYNEGYRFKDLAKHNSSHHTAKKGGDTGWIKAGELSPAFDAVAFNENHELNEIFTIDDPENQMFYLVIKTENKTPIEEITVLKFSESTE